MRFLGGNLISCFLDFLNISNFIPKILLKFQEYKQIAQEIREFYFKDAAIDEKTLNQYIEMLSDINFAYGIDKAVKRHATKTNSKTYYLRWVVILMQNIYFIQNYDWFFWNRFTIDSKLSFKQRENITSDKPAATHADDLQYVFR